MTKLPISWPAERLAEQALGIHADGLEHFLAEACVPAPDTDALVGAIAANHFYNCRLWREEDLARRIGVPDADIVANKRAIDRFNQARNDAVERIDEHLLSTLPIPQPGARHHSETPGSMVDRLSILALKIHHMAMQAQRGDAAEDHRRQCNERLLRLKLQHGDLAGSLHELLQDCLAARARFRVYRQFKMYNDLRYRGATPRSPSGR